MRSTLHLLRPALCLLPLFWITACLPVPADETQPERDVTRAALQFQATFDAADDAQVWQTYNRDGLLMDVVGGQFRVLMQLPGRYVWSIAETNRTADSLIEADVLVSEGEALYGVMCRASIQNDGQGYYFVLSHDGAFSIRRGERSRVEPLVQWQNHPAIHTDGRYNRLRAVCDGAYLGLYVNGEYVGGAQDTRYERGYAGIVAGQSPAMTTRAQINMDTFEIWSLE